MDETQAQNIYVNIVYMVCEDLSDIELAVFNNVAQLDSDPHGRLFDYDKVSPLFTEANGTQMHQATKAALTAVVTARLGE